MTIKERERSSVSLDEALLLINKLTIRNNLDTTIKDDINVSLQEQLEILDQLLKKHQKLINGKRL